MTVNKTKNWFVGITATKGSKRRVYEGDMYANRLVATYETEEAAARAVAEHNAEISATIKELEAEREVLHGIIRADVPGALNQSWLRRQEPMFTVGQPPEAIAALQAELDDIAMLRDEANRIQLEAFTRLREIDGLLYQQPTI